MQALEMHFLCLLVGGSPLSPVLLTDGESGESGSDFGSSVRGRELDVKHMAGPSIQS